MLKRISRIVRRVDDLLDAMTIALAQYGREDEDLRAQLDAEYARSNTLQCGLVARAREVERLRKTMMWIASREAIEGDTSIRDAARAALRDTDHAA